jgi:hypothetical protein
MILIGAARKIMNLELWRRTSRCGDFVKALDCDVLIGDKARDATLTTGAISPLFSRFNEAVEL